MSASVVPARAGMSPGAGNPGTYRLCGPRASGDEPDEALAKVAEARWSPRERG